MSANNMKIGYIQSSPIFGEKDKNFAQIEKFMKDVKADLIVLPELFATGYTFISKEEAQGMAEDANGITCKFLQQISQKTKAIVVGGFIEEEGSRIYNSAIMVNGKDIVGIYRKIHLFNKEKLWFSPGDKPFKIYEIKDVKIGMMICFDWFFPEATRSLSLLGAEIIAHPTNLVLPYCQDAMKIRCLENHVFAVTANRIGTEKRGVDKFSFTGGSQITSYDGEVLSFAPVNEIFMDIIEIDIKQANNKSLNSFNDILKDRRPELYKI